MNLKEKQAWILKTQNRMFSDQKALTSKLGPKEQFSKSTLLMKKPKLLTPLENSAKLTPSLKNDEFPMKKQLLNNNNKIDNMEIPEPDEWEFEEEMDTEVWDMMDGFDEKLGKKKEVMSELEKMELEHTKMKNITERLKKK